MYCVTEFSNYVNFGASTVALKIIACYVLRKNNQSYSSYFRKRFQKIIPFPH
jgi:hypothetical protein